MKRSSAVLICVFTLSLSTGNLLAQGIGFNGVGGRLGYFDPEALSGTVGIGAHANLGEIIKNLTLLPTVEYWGKSGLSQWSLAADARYHYSASEVNPFVGFGLGLYFTDAKNFGGSTDLGLDLLGGIDVPVGENLTFSGEIKFVVTEVNSIRISGGLTYFLNKAK